MKKINIYDTLLLIVFILLYFIFYLMAEVFWNYDWYIDKIDVKGDKAPDGFNENQIKDKARKYVESRIKEWISDENREKLLKEIKELLEKQDIERLDLIKELKQRENWEARENVDKEAMIQEAKTMIYEKLWINENQARNSKIENFLKWIVDELVIWNYELAIEIYNTNWKVIIESLKQLASWEWLKKMAESLWETIWNLFDWNAYEKWKSVAQLWLISTGVWLWVSVWKKAVKLWMKEITRLRPHINKESIVASPEIRWVVKETSKKVDEIVPKKQLDFSKMLVEDIAKLWDKERLEAGSFYLKWKKFTPEQERAILEAHNVWKDRKWAGIYTYTNQEIKQKAEILKQVWFSVEERRILLEKWVCWNESIYSIGNRLKPEQKEKLEKHWEKLKEQKEFLDRRLELSEFEKLSIPEKLKSLWIPKDFYDLLNESWVLSPKFDIIERYKKLKYWDNFLNSKMPIDYESMIEKTLSKHPDLTRSEAFLVFAYTDNFLYKQLNNKLRDSSYVLTTQEKKLVNALNTAFAKMPELEWNFIVRWDSWKWWITPDNGISNMSNFDIFNWITEWNIRWYKVWDTIHLDWFTSVSNNLGDVFIWKEFPKNNTLVIINWERWRIRDISSLAMFTNFAEQLLRNNTTFEWVIMSNSKVQFTGASVKQIELIDKKWWKYIQNVLEVSVNWWK